MKMVKRSYQPRDYDEKITVVITEEQAERLAILDNATAYFWAKKIVAFNNHYKEADGSKVIIADGKYFVLGSEYEKYKAFGGRRFDIEYIKGEQKGEAITSTNLWFLSVIPEELSDILVDNAIME